MKRLVLAVGIITSICSASLAGSHYVNTTLDELISVATDNPDNLTETWNKKKELLSVLLKNDDTAGIEALIYSDFNTDELTALLKSIKDGEQFTLGNIF